MIEEIDELAKRVENLRNSSSIEDSLASLANELKNIRTNISPVSINASSNASAISATMGAMTVCSFGVAPSSYMSTRFKTLSGNMPSSNITDSNIGVNILPFVGCSNPANPTMSWWYFPWICIPALSPFIPTSPNIFIENIPITTIKSKAMCTFASGGVVSFAAPGQINVKAT